MAGVSDVDAPSVLTPEILSLVGVQGPVRTMPYPLTHDEIRRFSQAAMEIDAIHWSREEAQRRGYDDIVAPPLYPLHALRRDPGTPDPLDAAYGDPDWDGIELVEDGLPPLDLPLERLLNGGVTAQVHDLAMPGDLISAQAKYHEITERAGRSGPMVLVVVETHYRAESRALLTTHTTMIAR